MWYVLVLLGALHERARFYVVPTNVISPLVYVGRRVWLAGTKRDGSARKDTSMRAIRPEQLGAYQDAWELLLKPASEAPEHLNAWVYDWAPETGLPDGHPGLARAGQALGASDKRADNDAAPMWLMRVEGTEPGGARRLMGARYTDTGPRRPRRRWRQKLSPGSTAAIGGFCPVGDQE